jgi:8-oxo-dGTP diphosphatase
MQKVVAAIIQRDGRILVAQRDTGHLAGKWEFPGGKVEGSESLEDALVREIQEEFGTLISVERRIGEVPFQVGEKEFILFGFYARHVSGNYAIREHKRIRWVRPSRLLDLDFSPADVPIARMVIRGLSGASQLP